jgi:hypothetical protein
MKGLAAAPPRDLPSPARGHASIPQTGRDFNSPPRRRPQFFAVSGRPVAARRVRVPPSVARLRAALVDAASGEIVWWLFTKHDGGLGGFMSKLDEAQRRLQQAVSGLERAVRDRAARTPASDSANGAASGDEIARRVREIAELKARNAELVRRNDTAASRLDAAIGRVRAVLED